MSICLINNRSDLGAGTRGADTGIRAMEIAAINQGNDFFNRFRKVELNTQQDSIYKSIDTPFAKRIEFIVDQCERLSISTCNELLNNNFPLILSGDHSSAVGAVSGIKKAFPDAKIGVVWIDAHADLHSPFTTPSGNVHGMPLAALSGIDNLEEQINNVNELTEEYWSNYKSISDYSPVLSTENIVFFGVRDTETPEDNLIEKEGIKNFTVSEVRFRGMEVCLNETMDILNDCDLIYISFDVDSLDCNLISKGTGTPVANGFDENEAKTLIQGLLKSEKVCCLEFVEINPTLDNHCNKMAETAFDILDCVSRSIIDKNVTLESSC